jgi:hypothetical protein
MKSRKFPLEQILPLSMNMNYATCASIGGSCNEIMVFMLERSLYFSQLSDYRVIKLCREELLRQLRNRQIYLSEVPDDLLQISNIFARARDSNGRTYATNLGKKWVGRVKDVIGETLEILSFEVQPPLPEDDWMVEHYGPA